MTFNMLINKTTHLFIVVSRLVSSEPLGIPRYQLGNI